MAERVVTDQETSRSSASSSAPRPSPSSSKFGWSALLGDKPGNGTTKPLAAAARATDLHGLPSTFIAVGALDLFVDEDLAIAHRLVRAGVPTELHVHAGGVRGCIGLPHARIAISTRHDLIDALRRSI